MPFDDRAIAIIATFTAEAIQPALAFWAGELGLDSEIRFAGYNTLFQQLLDPGGLFASNRGGINVALARFEDWLAAGIGDQVRRFGEAVRTAAASFPAPLIVAVCPPSPGREHDFDARLAGLREAISDLAGVHLIAPSQVQALYLPDFPGPLSYHRVELLERVRAALIPAGGPTRTGDGAPRVQR